MARFTDLADTSAGTILLDFNSAGLSAGTSSSIAVSPATPDHSAGGGGLSIAVKADAPTIRLEHVVRARKTGEKGKPVGKPVLVGFALDYSTAMDPSTAGFAADYQVGRAATKRVKKQRITVLEPVKFTAAYDPSSDSVTLRIKGKPTFAKGGQIKIIASAPNGVSSEAGVLLDTSDTVFRILAKARGIAPG